MTDSLPKTAENRNFSVLSLFAGIGGFDLGLERTGGFKTVAFCEIEPFAVRVLNKHWPEVPVYGDVRELTADRLKADGIVPNVIVGGFPCQDISLAGKGAGLAGERSGLWSEYSRLIGELRPAYVIVENVAALLSRGLGDVLGDLASLGYDAEWHCIPASRLGAHHRRDRIWIIAHPNSKRQPGSRQSFLAQCPTPYLNRQTVDALAGCLGHVWGAEPALGRVAHGVPHRVDRLRCLGNAVVPQIPELIGRAILQAEAA